MSPPRAFLLGGGGAFAVLALLGIALPLLDKRVLFAPYLVFDIHHAALQGALAVVMIGIGLAPMPPAHGRRVAVGLGILFLGIAVVGFISPRIFGYPARFGSPMRLELTEDLVYLILGLWGAYVGTTEPDAPAPAA